MDVSHQTMAENTYKGSIPDLREFWEEKGKTRSFEEEYGIRLEGIQRIAAQIRPYLQTRLILDVGCGPGIAASFFPANSRVTGLDFSTSMLRSAKARIPTLLLASAFELPFRNCSFDVVTCLFVASDYSHKTDIFSEAYRVLREGGSFLFSDYSPNDEHWKFRRTIRSIMGQTPNLFIEDEAFLLTQTRRAGFKVEKTTRVQFHASFKLERYMRSEDEMSQLRKENLGVWNNLQRCIRSKEIEREFILIVGVK
jgi:ubiquinone/menaquinone biosynthesis C-methylase UbiE